MNYVEFNMIYGKIDMNYVGLSWKSTSRFSAALQPTLLES